MPPVILVLHSFRACNGARSIAIFLVNSHVFIIDDVKRKIPGFAGIYNRYRITAQKIVCIFYGAICADVCHAFFFRFGIIGRGRTRCYRNHALVAAPYRNGIVVRGKCRIYLSFTVDRVYRKLVYAVRHEMKRAVLARIVGVTGSNVSLVRACGLAYEKVFISGRYLTFGRVMNARLIRTFSSARFQRRVGIRTADVVRAFDARRDACGRSYIGFGNRFDVGFLCERIIYIRVLQQSGYAARI